MNNPSGVGAGAVLLHPLIRSVRIGEVRAKHPHTRGSCCGVFYDLQAGTSVLHGARTRGDRNGFRRMDVSRKAIESGTVTRANATFEISAP